jgi:hypothetical protein
MRVLASGSAAAMLAAAVVGCGGSADGPKTSARPWAQAPTPVRPPKEVVATVELKLPGMT